MALEKAHQAFAYHNSKQSFQKEAKFASATTSSRRQGGRRRQQSIG